MHLPDVVITHPAKSNGPRRARASTITIDGQDITTGVLEFRVGGESNGAIELNLKLVVGSITWTEGAAPPEA